MGEPKSNFGFSTYIIRPSYVLHSIHWKIELWEPQKSSHKKCSMSCANYVIREEYLSTLSNRLRKIEKYNLMRFTFIRFLNNTYFLATKKRSLPTKQIKKDPIHKWCDFSKNVFLRAFFEANDIFFPYCVSVFLGY